MILILINKVVVTYETKRLMGSDYMERRRKDENIADRFVYIIFFFLFLCNVFKKCKYWVLTVLIYIYLWFLLKKSYVGLSP